jgi:hypothetical protein
VTAAQVKGAKIALGQLPAAAPTPRHVRGSCRSRKNKPRLCHHASTRPSVTSKAGGEHRQDPGQWPGRRPAGAPVLK